MTTEENKALVRRLWDQWTAEHVAKNADLLGEDYRHHDRQFPPDLQEGRDRYMQGVQGFFVAFPDLRPTILDLIAEGDRVASHVIFSGTHEGELFGVPPTGRHVEIEIMCIHRLEGGKIVEGWNLYDALGTMQQVGAIPTPEGAGSAS